MDYIDQADIWDQCHVVVNMKMFLKFLRKRGLSQPGEQEGWTSKEGHCNLGTERKMSPPCVSG